MSTGLIIVLCIIFLYCLWHAYHLDIEHVETGNREHHSHVKKMLSATRESLVRGAILSGNPEIALSWALFSGSHSLVSERYGWRTFIV